MHIPARGLLCWLLWSCLPTLVVVVVSPDGSCITAGTKRSGTSHSEKMSHERASGDGETVPFNYAAASSRDAIVYGSGMPAMPRGASLPEVGSLTAEMILPWVEHMKSNGIVRVVVLVDDNELEWYAPPGLIHTQRTVFKSVVNIPMCVWNSWDLIYQQILEAEAAQEKIVFHCVHGEGRTGRVLAAWLMCKYGLTAEDAAAEVLAFAKVLASAKRLENYVKVGYDNWRKDAVHHPPGWTSRKAFELHNEWKKASKLSPHGTAYPQVMHRQLTSEDIPPGSRVVIIGDVHGCCRTLDLLLQECRYDPSKDVVIFVGDLVHKGPDSVAVVRRARELRALCVRGNHDDAALYECVERRHAHAVTAADVGERDAKRQRSDSMADDGQAEYQPESSSSREARTAEEETARRKAEKSAEYAWTDGLDDEDLSFLASLPYTLTLPHTYDIGGHQRTVLIVHAGLVAGVELEEQRAEDMYKMRDVVPARTSASDSGDVESGAEKPQTWEGRQLAEEGSVGWVQAWTGPEHIYFGHDATRRLQQSPFATGLDSAACYGHQLSAAILPGGEIKSVSAKPEFEAFNSAPKA